MTASPNRRLRRQSCRKFLGDFYAVIIYAIFYIPVLVMMVFSFNNAKRNYTWEGFTTQWYESSSPLGITTFGSPWPTLSQLRYWQRPSAW